MTLSAYRSPQMVIPMVANPAPDQDTRAEEHGRLIKERRLDLGLNRPAFVAEMARHGQDITPDYLNKLENGRAPLSRASLSVREALRAVLGFSTEQWQEATGLYAIPRGGPPIPPRLPSLEIPLEIPPGLQEAIDRYSGIHPEFTIEKNLRAITSIYRYGGGTDFTPEEWLDIMMANRRWLVKN